MAVPFAFLAFAFLASAAAFRLQGPLAADAYAFGDLLFEELEDLRWQLLHNGDILSPLCGSRAAIEGVSEGDAP